MNTEKITSLFLLFSGEESAEEFEPIIDLAVRLTEKMLNSEADKSDLRVDFLAAALANYHVQQLKSAHDRTTAAFTGKMLTNGENSASGMLKSFCAIICSCAAILSSQKALYSREFPQTGRKSNAY